MDALSSKMFKPIQPDDYGVLDSLGQEAPKIEITETDSVCEDPASPQTTCDVALSDWDDLTHHHHHHHHHHHPHHDSSSTPSSTDPHRRGSLTRRTEGGPGKCPSPSRNSPRRHSPVPYSPKRQNRTRSSASSVASEDFGDVSLSPRRHSPVPGSPHGAERPSSLSLASGPGEEYICVSYADPFSSPTITHTSEGILAISISGTHELDDAQQDVEMTTPHDVSSQDPDALSAGISSSSTSSSFANKADDNAKSASPDNNNKPSLLQQEQEQEKTEERKGFQGLSMKNGFGARIEENERDNASVQLGRGVSSSNSIVMNPQQSPSTSHAFRGSEYQTAVASGSTTKSSDANCAGGDGGGGFGAERAKKPDSSREDSHRDAEDDPGSRDVESMDGDFRLEDVSDSESSSDEEITDFVSPPHEDVSMSVEYSACPHVRNCCSSSSNNNGSSSSSSSSCSTSVVSFHNHCCILANKCSRHQQHEPAGRRSCGDGGSSCSNSSCRCSQQAGGGSGSCGGGGGGAIPTDTPNGSRAEQSHSHIHSPAQSLPSQAGSPLSRVNDGWAAGEGGGGGCGGGGGGRRRASCPDQHAGTSTSPHSCPSTSSSSNCCCHSSSSLPLSPGAGCSSTSKDASDSSRRIGCQGSGSGGGGRGGGVKTPRDFALCCVVGSPPLTFPHCQRAVLVHCSLPSPYDPQLPTPPIVLTPHTSYDDLNLDPVDPYDAPPPHPHPHHQHPTSTSSSTVSNSSSSSSGGRAPFRRPDITRSRSFPKLNQDELQFQEPDQTWPLLGETGGEGGEAGGGGGEVGDMAVDDLGGGPPSQKSSWTSSTSSSSCSNRSSSHGRGGDDSCGDGGCVRDLGDNDMRGEDKEKKEEEERGRRRVFTSSSFSTTTTSSSSSFSSSSPHVVAMATTSSSSSSSTSVSLPGSPSNSRAAVIGRLRQVVERRLSSGTGADSMEAASFSLPDSKDL